MIHLKFLHRCCATENAHLYRGGSITFWASFHDEVWNNRLINSFVPISAITLLSALLWAYTYDFPEESRVIFNIFASLSTYFAFHFFITRPFTEAEVFFVSPGESLPTPLAATTKSHFQHYFSVRLQSRYNKIKYLPYFLSDDDDSPEYVKKLGLTCLNRLHEESFQSKISDYGLLSAPVKHNRFSCLKKIDRYFKRKSPRQRQFETEVLPDYWSLLIFSLSEQLTPEQERRAGAIYRFALLLGRPYLLIYTALILFVTLITPLKLEIIPKPSKTWLGFAFLVWATSSLILYYRKVEQLSQWEKKHSAQPFSINPIYIFQPHQHPHWVQLSRLNFGKPIHSFGPEAEKIIQIILATLLIIALTLIQLVE